MNIKLLVLYYNVIYLSVTIAREWKTKVETLDAMSNKNYEIYSTWDDYKVNIFN